MHRTIYERTVLRLIQEPNLALWALALVPSGGSYDAFLAILSGRALSALACVPADGKVSSGLAMGAGRLNSDVGRAGEPFPSNGLGSAVRLAPLGADGGLICVCGEGL